jgi:hypothetical protein
VGLVFSICGKTNTSLVFLLKIFFKQQLKCIENKRKPNRSFKEESQKGKEEGVAKMNKSRSNMEMK